MAPSTIRGHVSCSFPASILLKELQTRMEQPGWTEEWDRLKPNLDMLLRSATNRFRRAG